MTSLVQRLPRYLNDLFSLQRLYLFGFPLSFTAAMTQFSKISVSPAEYLPSLSQGHRVSV